MRSFPKTRKSSVRKANRRLNRRRRFEQLERRDMFSGLVGLIPMDATGDFNGDGYEDGVIGSPREEMVEIHYGGGGSGGHEIVSAVALRALSDTETWSQDSPGILGKTEAGDGFGETLAVGDFNGDGYDDLAIGSPSEDIGNWKTQAGAVNIIYGSSDGLTSKGNQIWHQDSVGIAGSSEAGDLFGNSLVAGDFNGDGCDDLAIGVPHEKLGNERGEDNHGVVNVMYGSHEGLTAEGDQIWSQNSRGIAGTSESADEFGNSLAAGDFNGDGL